MKTLNKTTQAIIKWNSLNPMDKLEVMKLAGANSKQIKRNFDKCIEYLKAN